MFLPPDSPLEDYQIINEELGKYQYRLLERPQVVVANKMDLVGAEKNLARFKDKYPEVDIYPTTTIIDEGLQPVLYKVADLLEVTPTFPIEEEKSKGVLYKFSEEAPEFIAKNLGNGQFELSGDKLERLFMMTNFTTEASIYRFAQQLKRMGVDAQLHKMGAKEGDLVRIMDYEFEFIEE